MQLRLRLLLRRRLRKIRQALLSHLLRRRRRQICQP
jgi:hypothetical protein